MLIFQLGHSSIDQLAVLLSIQEPIPTPFLTLTLDLTKEEGKGVEGTVMEYPGVTSLGLGGSGKKREELLSDPPPLF